MAFDWPRTYDYIGIIWDSMCDKIDTGLVDVAESARACLSAHAKHRPAPFPFGSFATMTFALVWYRIPDILQWFGVLETV